MRALRERLADYGPLVAIARPVLRQLRAWIHAARQAGAAILADDEGVLLAVAGGRGFEPWLLPGQRLSEATAGTSAVALACGGARLAVVSGPEHYCADFHDWACCAAPVPVKGGRSRAVLALAVQGCRLPQGAVHILRAAAEMLGWVWSAWQEGSSGSESDRSIEPRVTAVLERVASWTVHEVRNPLAAVRASAELAAMLQASERREAVLKHVVSSIDELETVLAEVLGVVRPDQMPRSAVDLLAVVTQAARELEAGARRSGVSLKVSAPTRAPLIYGNDRLLRYALDQLLRRAVRGTPSGGVVHVRCEHRRRQGNLIVRISHPAGGEGWTGGLADSAEFFLVQRIIGAAHGGRVSMQTRPGAGTIVRVELPAAGSAGSG